MALPPLVLAANKLLHITCGSSPLALIHLYVFPLKGTFDPTLYGCCEIAQHTRIEFKRAKLTLSSSSHPTPFEHSSKWFAFPSSTMVSSDRAGRRFYKERGQWLGHYKDDADFAALNNIVNAERRGKRQVLIRPSSKVVIKVLGVLQKHG